MEYCQLGDGIDFLGHYEHYMRDINKMGMIEKYFYIKYMKFDWKRDVKFYLINEKIK
jgi:hypothetical protein